VRHDARIGARLRDVDRLGAQEVLATSQITARIAARAGSRAETSDALEACLRELRGIVEELDPGRFGLDEPSRRRVLGLVPVGDRLDGYLERHAEARGRVEEILGELHEDADALVLETATRRQDERSLEIEVEGLRRYAVLAGRLDVAVEARADELERSDGARARWVRDDVLLPVRARRRDLLVHLTVAAQTLAALEALDADDRALRGAIDIARTTTLAALQTASVVARMLARRRDAAHGVEAASRAGAGMAGESASFIDRLGAADALAPPDELGAAVAELRRSWRTASSALAAVDEVESRTRSGRPDPGEYD
jgi:uncharacterized protein YaaN involved in tellurite resistance